LDHRCGLQVARINAHSAAISSVVGWYETIARQQSRHLPDFDDFVIGVPHSQRSSNCEGDGSRFGFGGAAATGFGVIGFSPRFVRDLPCNARHWVHQRNSFACNSRPQYWQMGSLIAASPSL